MALTIKQENFCLEYMKDGNASRAYRAVYSTANMKEATVNREAKSLTDHPNISARIEELRKQATNSAILSLEQRKEILSKMASDFGKEDSKVYAADARGAIDLLNKMDGVYVEKKKLEVDGDIGLSITKIERKIIDDTPD